MGAAVTINNAGVTSIVAGTGISISGATGAVTITNASSISGTLRGQVFTTPGANTFNIPTGVTAVKVTVIGGGGGGGQGSSSEILTEVVAVVAVVAQQFVMLQD